MMCLKAFGLSAVCPSIHVVMLEQEFFLESFALSTGHTVLIMLYSV